MSDLNAAVSAKIQDLESDGLITEMPFRPLKRGTLKSLISGDNVWKQLFTIEGSKVSYLLDSNKHIFLSEREIDYSTFNASFIKNTDTMSDVHAIVPIEAGDLSYDKKSRKWTFTRRYSRGVLPEENAAELDLLQSRVPEGTAIEESDWVTHEQLLTCSDRIAIDGNLKSFLGMSLAIEMGIQGATSLMEKQFSTPEERATTEARLSFSAGMQLLMTSGGASSAGVWHPLVERKVDGPVSLRYCQKEH